MAGWAGLWLAIDSSGVARQNHFTSRDRLFRVDMATDGNEGGREGEGAVDKDREERLRT